MKLVLIVLLSLSSLMSQADVETDKILAEYHFVVDASQIELLGDTAIMFKDTRVSYSIAGFMFEYNSCPNCMCLGLEPEEGELIGSGDRLKALHGDIAKGSGTYYLKLIVGVHQQKAYTGFSFVHKETGIGDFERETKAAFGDVSVAEMKVISKARIQSLDTRAIKKIERNYVSEHKEKQLMGRGATVSATAMNVLYRSISNPISVTAAGVDYEDLYVTVSNSKLSGENGEYQVIPGKGKSCRVIVYGAEGGDTVQVSTFVFRVKNIPNPIASIGGHHTSKIKRTILMAAYGISARMEHFEFDLSMRVVSYDMEIIMDGKSYKNHVDGAKFTSEIRRLLRKVKTDDVVRCTNIKAELQGPERLTRTLADLSLTVK